VGGYDRTIAPSAVLEKTGLGRPRAMPVQEIERTIEEFAAAARRALESGFGTH
jgi:2,4-dienoyl-CoA reductase-like NADH-dependent reductase (Old Yellow Enzyme family)